MVDEQNAEEGDFDWSTTRNRSSLGNRIAVVKTSNQSEQKAGVDKVADLVARATKELKVFVPSRLHRNSQEFVSASGTGARGIEWRSGLESFLTSLFAGVTSMYVQISDLIEIPDKVFALCDKDFYVNFMLFRFRHEFFELALVGISSRTSGLQAIDSASFRGSVSCLLLQKL